MGIKKKILIGVIAAAGVAAGVYITLAVVRNNGRKPVNVYKMSDVAQTDYWGDQQDNYGMVSSDQVQNVFLSSTQTVSRVFVTKGQQVKAGDPLLAYDTTLSQINIERAENDLNQQKRTLDLARKELDKMQKTKPAPENSKVVTPSAVEPDSPTEDDPESAESPADVPENGGTENNGGTNGKGQTSAPEKTESSAISEPDYGNKADTNYQGKAIGEARSYKTPALLDGIGTMERPAIWIWSEDDELSDGLLKEIFNETLRARQEELSSDGDETLVGRSFKDGDGSCYIVLRQYIENNPFHKKIAEHGLLLELKKNQLNVSLFNPDLLKVREKTSASDASSLSEPAEADSGLSETESVLSDESGKGLSEGQEDNETDQAEGVTDLSGDVSYGGDGDTDEAARQDGAGTGSDSSADSSTDGGEDYSSMTRSELNKAINDQKIKIRDQEITVKLAEIKLRQMKHEMSDGIVRSKLNGVVKTVRDPQKAYEANKACVSVSNGGGYTIRFSISELALSSVKKGMTAMVTSQENGNTTEGKVISIGTTPSTDNYSSANNPNVSYYPCVVQLPETSDFKENEFVSVTLGSTSSQQGLFLDSMYIRSDEGGSYVYIKGKDGRLEKRYIRTGRDIGSGTMEILKGLTIRDRIAFPYGSNVEEGAKTKNSSTDALYGDSVG